MTARQEYELSHAKIDVGTKRKPRLVDTVNAIAKNVDCGGCGCPSVRNGGMVRTPPMPGAAAGATTPGASPGRGREVTAPPLTVACTRCGRVRAHTDLVGGDLCGRCRGLPAVVDDTAPGVWVLRATGTRPLTVNAVAGMHRQRWAAHTAEVRALWWGLAKEAKVPALGRAVITAIPLHADNRSPQDPAACAPEVKAAIDGLVDARVLADDDGEHVAAVIFHPPLVDGVDGLELVIEAA